MKIVFNDFPGHAAFADLSRALGELGYQVLHIYCSNVDSPSGDLSPTRNSRFLPLSVGGEFPKHRPLARLRAEVRYGLRSGIATRRAAPTVVIVNQMPVVSLNVMRMMVPDIPLIVWLQDIQSGLARSSPVRGAGMIGYTLGILERRALCSANLIMPVAEPMLSSPVLRRVPGERLRGFPNWASPETISPKPKVNPWSELHGLTDREVVLYTGTLGIKHNHKYLLNLARLLTRTRPWARVVVVSSGEAWEWLALEANREGLDNLITLPTQPHHVVPDMLGSADVLLATLLPETADYSVPSKVLSYLCAGRPVVALVPDNNPVADLINNDAQAGLATPDDRELDRFILSLLADRGAAETYGQSGRTYAEANFDLVDVAHQIAQLANTVVTEAEDPDHTMASTNLGS